MVYEWVTSISSKVRWVPKASWVESNNIYTASIHAFNALLVDYTIWSLKRMSDKSIPIFSVRFKF
ncbi:MAG: hypothetical protein ACI87J_002177 [Colwellia sp.]|jgi:hypothetical protein